VLSFVPPSKLSFVPHGLIVQQILPTPEQVTILARPQTQAAVCPDCAVVSSRLHSRYRRTVSDLPAQGRTVVIHLTMRRYRCGNHLCQRRSFSERTDLVVPAFARRMARLGDLQRYLSLVLGGEAGARLASRLATPVSADTLRRMARKAGRDAAPVPTPRVLGIDDWAWRRGHRYGTMLVDIERNRVIELLPDRKAETVATWLKHHPGVEIVARDRAGAYADGVRQGAPKAIQVADRWHILRNLGDAVKTVTDRFHAVIERIGKESVSAAVPAVSVSVIPQPASQSSDKTQASGAHRRRQAAYDEATRLFAAGASISHISRVTGADRKTLRGWLQRGGIPRWNQPRRRSLLDPYRAHLRQRWAEGCRNATRLWREVADAGFSGRAGFALLRARTLCAT
jgi:transposase